MERPEGLYQAPKSLTVSILAWLGIIGGAMGTLAVLGFFFSQRGLPPLGSLLGPPATLVASLALRKRRNWARLSYIGVTGLGMASLVVSIVRQGLTTPLVIVGLGGLAFQGFILAKLCSRDVREEFDALD